MSPMIEPLESRVLCATTRLAIVGDYGADTAAEAQVAQMIHRWRPAAVLTTGDNNYPDGAATTIDANVGRHYGRYLLNYTGAFGSGSRTRRFFPVPGNHDWQGGSLQPYLDYFDLPNTTPTGGERYYDFSIGSAQFFAVDSDPAEPDGITADSVQGQWLRSALAASSAAYKVVYFHHPPYSSGPHGPTAELQWPFAEWGANLVLSGHDHTYERLAVDGIPYIVNGLGGVSRYDFSEQAIRPESLVRFNAGDGAIRIDLSRRRMRLRFITTSGQTIDQYDLLPNNLPPRVTVDATAPTALAGRKLAITLQIQNQSLVWSGRTAVSISLSGTTVLARNVKLKLADRGSAVVRLRIRLPETLPPSPRLDVTLSDTTIPPHLLASTFLDLQVSPE